jgi:DNA-binding CsgD family transcriptional regulator
MTRVLIFKEPHSFELRQVDAPAEQIVSAINRGQWEQYLSALKSPVFARQQGDVVIVTHSAPIPEEDLPRLSRREHQVLVLLGEGLTTAQIALKLNLSSRTIRGYVGAIKARFGAQNIQQLVARAVALGLIHPNL